MYVFSPYWSNTHLFLLYDQKYCFTHIKTFNFSHTIAQKTHTKFDFITFLATNLSNPIIYWWYTSFMPYYCLFWTRSPYLDLRWRSRSTGTIPELLITSIVWHKNKNRWVGDPLRRSCELFCVVIFHSSFGLVKYPYTKQFTWSPQGIPPSPVLVIVSVKHINDTYCISS